jgi:bacterioferritin-associated ferredoxin
MIVCVCNAIREDELRAAARDGASCPINAFASLDCEPQCGCCLNCAQDIIDEERGTSARRKGSRVVIEFPRAA